MTFQAFETSRQKGEPVTLYRFRYSESANFAYTDAEQEITHAGITYEPIPIMRDAVTASGTLDKSALAVRMPRDVELSELFRVYPPAQVVALIIRQGHLTDTPTPQFLVVWSGRVLSVGREGEECVVSCEPISSSLRRPGLRRHYQLGCPHQLYGPHCKAVKATHSVTAEVASISGTQVIMVDGWNGAFDTANFREGMIEWTNDAGGTERRKILRVATNALRVGGLLRDLTAGETVTASLGCNHQMTDCQDLFDNIQNFGGCPWIPTKNPIGIHNNYY